MDFHFAGEAGGGAPGANSEGTPNPEPTPNAGEGGKAEADKTKDAEKDKSKLSPKEQLEAITKEHEELKGKYDAVTHKLGKQSADVGKFKEFTQTLKEKPKNVIAALAKQANVKVFFDEPNKVDLAKLISEGSAEEQAKALEAMNTQAKDPRVDMVLEKLSVLDEQQMAQKYPDWDELGDSRDLLGLSAAAGKISQSEIHHLAAKGLHLPEALEAAKKQAVEEYIESLQDKTKGQIDASRGRHRISTQESVVTLESILDSLKD